MSYAGNKASSQNGFYLYRWPKGKHSSCKIKLKRRTSKSGTKKTLESLPNPVLKGGCVLDVLFFHAYLTPAQHEVGKYYEALWRQHCYFLQAPQWATLSLEKPRLGRYEGKKQALTSTTAQEKAFLKRWHQLQEILSSLESKTQHILKAVILDDNHTVLLTSKQQLCILALQKLRYGLEVLSSGELV